VIDKQSDGTGAQESITTPQILASELETISLDNRKTHRAGLHDLDMAEAHASERQSEIDSGASRFVIFGERTLHEVDTLRQFAYQVPPKPAITQTLERSKDSLLEICSADIAQNVRAMSLTEYEAYLRDHITQASNEIAQAQSEILDMQAHFLFV
jgi:hypothetical protein